jgi:serine phosphatase RsbU (regulator of sigma subunit)
MATGDGRLVRNLNSLLEVSKAMAAAVDLDSVLAVIRSRATEVMEAERGSIFVHDERTGTLWNRASEGLASGRARVAVGTGIAGHVAQTGELLNVPDAYRDPRFSPETDRQTDFRTRSILCAPLIGHSGKLLGVIQVLNKSGGGVFTRDDEALLQAFASHAGIALDRAQLVEAQLEKQRIEQGLRLAHDIQMAMLPRRFPERPELELVAETRPARSVGGDLYDYFVDGDRLWFLVGDVSGKGVAAALFMAVAKTLFRASAPGASSPAAVFARVSGELGRDNEAGMFVTAAGGWLELASGRVVATNAGHPPPYHLGTDGSLTQVTIPPGLPLGMSLGAHREGALDYPAVEFSLRPGEGLYLYSDGVTEAFDARDEEFGAPRLEAYLRGAAGASAAALAHDSLAAVARFVGDHPPSDDITVMAVRYLGHR